MNCEQCGKEIEINAICWYLFRSGDIICDDCNNKNLSENLEQIKALQNRGKRSYNKLGGRC